MGAAAVADWRVGSAQAEKLKKGASGPPALGLVENPDILATIASHENRPRLGVGFAADTEKVIDHAQSKLARKKCDLIVANDVSPASGVMGGDINTVHLISQAGVETWPTMSKQQVADKLVARLATMLTETRS